jgi:hypothetical protein
MSTVHAPNLPYESDVLGECTRVRFAVGLSQPGGAPTTATALAPMAKYKVVFLGDQSVGKTCIIRSFMFGGFTPSYKV